MTEREEPVQDYYPSARVRLIVRLEDFGEDDTPDVPPKPTTVRRGNKDVDTELLAIQTLPDGSLLLTRPGANVNQVGSPQQQMQSADSRTHVIEGIIPTVATLNRNGIRQADTLSMEIKFRDMPIDLKVVRACAVQYFLGTVSPEDFQRGLEGGIRDNATVTGTGLPYQVVPDNYTDAEGRQRTNLRFEGWVDTWDDDWPKGESPIVSLECTDNTRLLIEQSAPPKLTISAKEPIHRAIAVYLSNFPQFEGLSVAYLPKVQEKDIPVLKDVLQRTAFRPKLGPSVAKGGSSKLSVWDYITDVTGSIGHGVRMEGTKIIVQRSRSLYSNQFAGRVDDPFFQSERRLRGQRLPRRLLIYGRNIQEMSFKRQFATYAPQNIEVRCYDNTRKKTLVARYPGKGDEQKRLNPGEAGDRKWFVVRVAGIKDPAILRVVAQNVYEQMGRNEIVGHVATKNLGTFGGGNLDPDALDALPGDAVDVVVQRNEEGKDRNTITNLEAEVKARPAAFLQDLGFSTRFAAAYAEAVQNIGLQTTFRIRTISLGWDATQEGVSIDFELMNYVEIRADKVLPEGEELTPEDGQTPDPTPEVIVEDDVSG